MRLIDADALMDAVCKNLRDGDVLDRIPPSYIDKAPTVDAVPVVRCRDCRSYNKPRLRYCEVHLEHTSPDDFCSWGREKPDTQGGADNALN